MKIAKLQNGQELFFDDETPDELIDFMVRSHIESTKPVTAADVRQVKEVLAQMAQAQEISVEVQAQAVKAEDLAAYTQANMQAMADLASKVEALAQVVSSVGAKLYEALTADSRIINDQAGMPVVMKRVIKGY